MSLQSIGYRIGQIRVIFTIPTRHASKLFPNRAPPNYLVYVEWFTSFTRPDPTHGLYKVECSLDRDGKHIAEVRLLSDIRRSAHLNPCFGAVAPRHWTSANVLDQCPRFWVSSFMDRHAYGVVV